MVLMGWPGDKVQTAIEIGECGGYVCTIPGTDWGCGGL